MAYDKKLDWSGRNVIGLTKDLKDRYVDEIYFEFDYDRDILSLLHWSAWNKEGNELLITDRNESADVEQEIKKWLIEEYESNSFSYEQDYQIGLGDRLFDEYKEGMHR